MQCESGCRFCVKLDLRSTVGKHSEKFANCSSFILWIFPVAVQWVLRRFLAASFVIVVVSALMSTLCSLKIGINEPVTGR